MGGVSSDADVYSWSLDEEGRSGGQGGPHAPGPSLILATDGVWGVMSNEDVTRLVARARTQGVSSAAASEAICSAAQRAGGRDNLSVVVVFLE